MEQQKNETTDARRLYLVVWQAEISADSAEDAARHALAALQSTDSTAKVFEVGDGPIEWKTDRQTFDLSVEDEQ